MSNKKYLGDLLSATVKRIKSGTLRTECSVRKSSYITVRLIDVKSEAPESALAIRQGKSNPLSSKSVITRSKPKSKSASSSSAPLILKEISRLVNAEEVSAKTRARHRKKAANVDPSAPLLISAHERAHIIKIYPMTSYNIYTINKSITDGISAASVCMTDIKNKVNTADAAYIIMHQCYRLVHACILSLNTATEIRENMTTQLRDQKRPELISEMNILKSEILNDDNRTSYNTISRELIETMTLHSVAHGDCEEDEDEDESDDIRGGYARATMDRAIQEIAHTESFLGYFRDKMQELVVSDVVKFEITYRK